MSLPPQLLELITRHEGVRLQAYDDATGERLRPGYRLVGHPTIGIGRALDVNGISRDEANFLLARDVERVSLECVANIPVFNRLDTVRQYVVVSMVFNMGLKGFLSFKKFIKFLEETDWHEASSEMINSVWASQVGVRATELAKILRDGRLN